MSMRYPGGLIAPTPVNQQYPSGVWTGAQTTPYQANNVWANDSSFKSTTMLLHGDGATTPFIKDASTNNFQLTIAGDTKPNNLTPFITDGYWSNVFDGTGDYLSAPASSAQFSPGTSNLTVEGWYYFTNLSAGVTNLFGCNNGSGSTQKLVAYIEANGTIHFDLTQAGGASQATSASGAVVNNTWYHLAFVRNSSTATIYVNGTSVASGSATGNLSALTNPFYVGYVGEAYGVVMSGYISNFRYVNGTAVYTSAFTPPTSPLTAITNTKLLTCQSNRFVDNSTNALTITRNGDTAVSMQQPFTAPSGTSLYGSGYFDGNGDGITTPASSAFAFGTGDFTYEGWYYSLDTGSSVRGMFDTRITQASTAGVLLREDSGGFLVYINGGTLFTASGRVPYSWQHIALVRNSGTIRLYVNGVQVNSAANTTNFTDNYCRISGFIDTQASPYGYYGYVSNARVINGTCLYPSGTTFTPSTTPLTPVSGTSLLTLQTNGPANNNGFLDSSPNSLPITRNGNTTQGSFTPYRSNWSNYFDGSGDYLTVPNNAALNVGSSAFTIECWFYNQQNILSGAEAGVGTIFGKSDYNGSTTNGYTLFCYDGNNSTPSTNLRFFLNGVTFFVTTPAGAVPFNTWTHIAVVKSGTNLTIYCNGISSVTSSSAPSTVNDTSTVFILGSQINGTTWNGTYPLSGFVSNLRLVKGTAVYTAAFTPPTAPLTAITNTSLLTCQSNRFIDNSTNNFTITKNGDTSVQAFQPFVPTVQYTPSTLGGSGYFDGSGDYLSVVDNPALEPLNSSFSAELFIYFTSVSSDAQIFSKRANTTSYPPFQIILISGVVQLYMSSTGSSFDVVNAANIVTATVGQWYHIVVARSGTTISYYVNGVRSGTTTSSATLFNNTGPVVIGGDTNGAYSTGYISSVRYLVGASAYSASATTYTVPTAPITPITNTQLLCNFDNAAIFDNSGMNNLETVGNAQVNTGVVKYGTGSMYFDGTGDYLLLQGGQNFTFGTGDFTIEMWIYVVSGLSADIVYYDGRPTSTNGLYNIIYTNSTGKLVYSTNSADRITSTTTLSTTTWYHIALSRSGTNTKLFLNGIQEGGTYTDSNSYIVGTNRPVIGGNGYTLGNAPLNGYIDDLRITKGVARYVGNFTPPVARMPNQ